MSRLPGSLRPLLIGRLRSGNTGPQPRPARGFGVMRSRSTNRLSRRQSRPSSPRCGRRAFGMDHLSALSMKLRGTCDGWSVCRVQAINSPFSVTWSASLTQTYAPQYEPWRLWSLKRHHQAPLRRNTEYPFHDAAGEFTYPAIPGEFSPEEADRFRALSRRLGESAGWVVSTLRRRPR